MDPNYQARCDSLFESSRRAVHWRGWKTSCVFHDNFFFFLPGILETLSSNKTLKNRVERFTPPLISEKKKTEKKINFVNADSDPRERKRFGSHGPETPDQICHTGKWTSWLVWTKTPCCRDADFKNSRILTSFMAEGSQFFLFCLLHGFRHPCPSSLGLKRTSQNKWPSGVVVNLGCNPEVVTVTGGVCVSRLRLKVYLSSGRGQKRPLI